MEQYTNAVQTTTTSAVDSGQDVMTNMKSNMMYGLNNVKQYVESRSVTFWIVIILFLVVLIIFLVYEWWRIYQLFNKFVDCSACYIRFKNVISSPIDKRPILHKYLVKPNNGYTYSMWLYVANWYSRNGANQWKNVYYRGPPFKKNCPSAIQWDSFAQQQPGVWMSDNPNNLRVTVSTTRDVPTDCLEGEYRETSTQETVHPLNLPKPSNKSCVKNSSINTTSITILEYADIDNIPIGKWFQLLFVVDKTRLELYLDSKLVKTLVFVGEYIDTCSVENGHFGIPEAGKYDGRIMNFRYMPFVLPYQVIELLYIYESKNALLDIPNPMKKDDDSYGNILF